MSESIESKLSELAKLERNWDSYGADPIGEGAIQAVRIVASVLETLTVIPPQIMPTVNGGLAIEYSRGKMEFSIEFDSDGVFEDIFAANDITKEYYESSGSVAQSAEASVSKAE